MRQRSTACARAAAWRPCSACGSVRPRSTSRFGIGVDGREEVAALAGAIAGLPPGTRFGVHFHVSSTDIGIDDWFDLCRWVVLRAAEVQAASGIAVRCLDLGGGWHPDDLVEYLRPALPEIATTAKRRLPELDTIILEPGRAMVQPTMALLARVLEVRGGSAGREVVVDASISEVADADRYPHPVLVRRRLGGAWRGLGEGIDRVAGRSCMETDILAAGVELPADLSPGDLVVIDHVGAYDTSKSYVFGRG